MNACLYETTNLSTFLECHYTIPLRLDRFCISQTEIKILVTLHYQFFLSNPSAFQSFLESSGVNASMIRVLLMKSYEEVPHQRPPTYVDQNS